MTGFKVSLSPPYLRNDWDYINVKKFMKIIHGALFQTLTGSSYFNVKESLHIKLMFKNYFP